VGHEGVPLMLGFAVRFALALLVVLISGTAMMVGALYLAEGDCVWAKNEHLARCRDR
jgi:hypothetical protein